MIRSTSGDNSFTLVWDSNLGSLCFTEMTAVNPSRTSSPVICGSFSFNSSFDFEYWLMARVTALRKPLKCVPPSGL